MEKIKLGVDLDNVLNLNAQSIIDCAMYRYGIKGVTLKDFTQYHVENITPITSEMLSEMFNDPYYFYTVPPNLSAVDTINMLYRTKKFEIFIVTDRPVNCIMATYAWLATNKVSYDNLYLASAADKPEVAKTNDIEYFIEDRLDTAINLAKICKKVYLLDSPWNQGEVPSNVKRFENSWNFKELRYDWTNIFFDFIDMFEENRDAEKKSTNI